MKALLLSHFSLLLFSRLHYRYFLSFLRSVIPYFPGHSLGGKVAMRLVDERPSLVKNLVVVEMNPTRTDRNMYDLMGIIDSMLAMKLDEIRTRAHADKMLEETVKVTLPSFLFLTYVLLMGD